VNIALQQLMQDYAGVVRSETLLTAGLDYLRRMRKGRSIRDRTKPLGAHRCLETLNLLDLGELVFIGANAQRDKSLTQTQRLPFDGSGDGRERDLYKKKERQTGCGGKTGLRNRETAKGAIDATGHRP
jgi:succinate dehydrogenase/fumarate reductase flavoprotein subunit